jgi:hypothetical protein
VNASTHDLSTLLLELGRAGAELAPHPTDAAMIRFRPASLDAGLLDRLRSHRFEVLNLLCRPAPGDTDYVLTERLGAGAELGMPVHAGSAAWLIAVGESLGASGAAHRVRDGTVAA